MEVPIPYIRPIFQAYVRGYTPKIRPYIVQYLHFRILEFPLTVDVITFLGISKSIATAKKVEVRPIPLQ